MIHRERVTPQQVHRQFKARIREQVSLIIPKIQKADHFSHIKTNKTLFEALGVLSLPCPRYKTNCRSTKYPSHYIAALPLVRIPDRLIPTKALP